MSLSTSPHTAAPTANEALGAPPKLFPAHDADVCCRTNGTALGAPTASLEARPFEVEEAIALLLPSMLAGYVCSTLSTMALWDA